MEIYGGIKAGFAVGKLSVQVQHETDADVNNLSGGHVQGGGTGPELSVQRYLSFSMLIC